MSMSRRPLFALAFVLGALGGCFLSANVPPSFRYTCKVDGDCRVLTCRGDLITPAAADAAGMMLADNCDLVSDEDEPKYYEARQVCQDGLCEYPCDISKGTDDCPGGKGYNLCFNGACATACGNDPDRFPDPDSTCSHPQSCIIFGDDIPLDLIESFLPSGGGGGGSNSFIPSGSGSSSATADLEGTGICGVRCDDEGAPACPPGQYCSGAMCLPNCAEPTATDCAEGTKCFEFGDFAACLATCDNTSQCEVGEICVMGFGICRPTCEGEDAVPCSDGTTCDPTLKICVPETADTGTGTTG